MLHRLLPLLALVSAAHAAPLKLHVPSPDWRDQVIYFVMTDRFADGDPRNNDQGVGAYDPTRNDRYNGGDLRGVQQRLDYIQGLGATAVWITPPNRNQWVDPLLGFTGYHGYWAQHFRQVDPHVGSLRDYQGLSDALHRRGMYLVQDIVVNHVGNYFDYAGGWDPKDPAKFWVGNPKSKPTAAPTQWPFNLNDPRRAADRQAAIYHWTPALIDVKNPDFTLNHQMSGLDDLNTENPVVQKTLRDSFGWWVRQVGVDALRVDTVFYVPPSFFEDFMHHPSEGMAAVARKTGRKDFLVFGEGFGIDKPGQVELTRRIESYVRGPNGEPRMNGMLNFPLYGALQQVFAAGRPTAELAERLQLMLKVHSRPHHLPSFIDNHDVDRWLAGGSEASMQQALLAILTLPGIPVLYYGTEQGFTEQRAAMFAKGYGSGGRDRYDTAHPLYRRTAEMVKLRTSHKALTRGLPKVLAQSEGGAGGLAWTMAHEGEELLVVFNTAEHELLLDHLPVGAGTHWLPLFGLHGQPEVQQAAADGTLTLRLPARAGMVWRRAAAAATAPALAAPQLDALPAAPATGDFEVHGSAHGQTDLRLVVDGDLARAQALAVDAQGRFRARVSTLRMSEPAATHRVVAWSPTSGAISAAQTFRAALPWVLLADEADPAGDDIGPSGRYRTPTHESFKPGQAGFMDLLRTRVWQAGGSLKIELTMRDISTVWSPANGFDHLAPTLFLELPGRKDGRNDLPDQAATLPEGMRWHLRLRAHGWSNALFGPGAGEGKPVSPGARIETDAQARTITFTLPSAALGDPATFSGARLYVTTWDYDGGYRPLAPEAGPYTFGGGAAGGPRVLDASAVIVLR
jgi:glycosidase